MKSLAFALALALVLPGCLGNDEPQAIDTASLVGVDNETAAMIEARAALVPRNYSFAGQETRPQAVVWKNGTVDASTLAAYEDKNDRGGNRYGVVVVADDYTGLVPPGQPVEINVKLTSAMQPGASADLDIWIDVPGTRTDRDVSSQDEFNWKFTSKHASVSTIGVAGAKHEVGVAISNGRIAPGQTLAYALEVEVTYVKDALTPFHAWALEVPPEAGGLLFTSVKADGPEHVRSTFVLVDPADEPVGVFRFDEVYSATMFVPVSGPGAYVFYAWEMTGGFLEVEADAPVPDRLARPLPLLETATSLGNAPTPGLPARDWTHEGAATPGSGGTAASFSVSGTFPLRVTPWIGEGATGAAEVRVASTVGPVASLQRVARVDQGGNSLGYTQDAFNSEFFPENLAKGEYTVTFVNDSPQTELGYTVLTYQRETGAVAAPEAAS